MILSRPLPWDHSQVGDGGRKTTLYCHIGCAMILSIQVFTSQLAGGRGGREKRVRGLLIIVLPRCHPWQSSWPFQAWGTLRRPSSRRVLRWARQEAIRFRGGRRSTGAHRRRASGSAESSIATRVTCGAEATIKPRQLGRGIVELRRRRGRGLPSDRLRGGCATATTQPAIDCSGG